MKKFWGLRPYMEISDFISSVKPKELLSSEFNDILYAKSSGYFHVARSVYKNLNDKKLAKKIILKSIKNLK